MAGNYEEHRTEMSLVNQQDALRKWEDKVMQHVELLFQENSQKPKVDSKMKENHRACIRNGQDELVVLVCGRCGKYQ